MPMKSHMEPLTEFDLDTHPHYLNYHCQTSLGFSLLGIWKFPNNTDQFSSLESQAKLLNILHQIRFSNFLSLFLVTTTQDLLKVAAQASACSNLYRMGHFTCRQGINKL